MAKPTSILNMVISRKGVEKVKGRTYQGVEKPLPQTGKVHSLPRDKARGARAPGKRVSRTGATYWETRFNRSDALLSTV